LAKKKLKTNYSKEKLSVLLYCWLLYWKQDAESGNFGKKNKFKINFCLQDLETGNPKTLIFGISERKFTTQKYTKHS
jgi:hypothetical protein